ARRHQCLLLDRRRACLCHCCKRTTRPAAQDRRDRLSAELSRWRQSQNSANTGETELRACCERGDRQSPAPLDGPPHSILLFMILTPIPQGQLGSLLDCFMTKLADPFSRTVFCRIRATSPVRAVGAEAEEHRRAALSLARTFGMAVHPERAQCRF